MSGFRPRLGAARSSSIRALAGTILGNAPGFVLPFAISAVYGIGALTDAYFLAFAAATFVASIANVAVESNLLPAAHRARAHGRRAIGRLAIGAATRAALAAAVVFALVALVVPLLTPDATDEAAHVQSVALAWFGLYVTATAACSVLTAFLYAHERFFLPPASGSIRAIAGLAALVALPVSGAGLGGVAAAWAIGELVRLAGLGVALWTIAAPSDAPAGPPAPIWRPLLHHAASMCVVGAVPVIDRAFAAHLSPGAVTIIELADKVIFVPVLILTSSITVVAGNRWAKTHTMGGDPRADGAKVFRRLGLLSTAIAGGLILLAVAVAIATPTVFGVDSSTLAGVVAALAVGLPTAVLVNASIRFLTATGDTALLPRFATLTLVGNTALDAVGVAIIGLVGIALATTLTRTISMVLYLRYIFRADAPVRVRLAPRADRA